MTKCKCIVIHAGISSEQVKPFCYALLQVTAWMIFGHFNHKQMALIHSEREKTRMGEQIRHAN